MWGSIIWKIRIERPQYASNIPLPHPKEAERYPSEDNVVDGPEDKTIHVDVVYEIFKEFRQRYK
jgi:hypothetical protein